MGLANAKVLTLLRFEHLIKIFYWFLSEKISWILKGKILLMLNNILIDYIQNYIEAGDLDEFVNDTYCKFNINFGGDYFTGRSCCSKN